MMTGLVTCLKKCLKEKQWLHKHAYNCYYAVIKAKELVANLLKRD